MDENSILNGSMTLDMIYHPGLAQAYCIYQYLIFSLMTLLTLFAAYIILKKTPSEMGIYKMLIINQLAWSYALDLVLTIWIPINLVPNFMGYSMGIASFLGPYGVYGMIATTYFMYGGLAQSIVVSLIFRVSRLFKTTYYEDGSTWVKIGILWFVLIEIMLAIPTLIWLTTQKFQDITTLRQTLIQSEPIMSEVFALEPTVNGFNWYGNQFILTFGCIYYGIGLIGFTCFLILSCALFVVKMRQLSSHESSTTRKLQIMLFRTLMVQISLCFVTIALPIIILVYFLAAKNPYGSYYTQLGLFLLSFHGLLDTISMLYFIRPYRNYLFGLMKKMLRREKNKIISSAIYFT